MKRLRLVFAATVVLGTSVLAAAQQPDAAGCKDHPLLPTRMADYRIELCKVEPFGFFDFSTQKPPKTRVEGKVTTLFYAFTGPRANEPSGTAVVRNYENALRKVGATILQSDPERWVNGKVVSGGLETWVQAEKGNGKIWLHIVERKEMVQEIVADATALGDQLRTTGHAAVYGILFDTDRAELKPESAPALAEVAKLLKADPSLSLFVVGHTDNAGTPDHNLELSRARAQAVMQALVKEHGIAPARLRAEGCGPFAPVAPNTTEEGRVKNRRVELVKQ